MGEKEGREGEVGRKKVGGTVRDIKGVVNEKEKKGK